VDNLLDSCTSLIKVIELLEHIVLIVRLVAVWLAAENGSGKWTAAGAAAGWVVAFQQHQGVSTIHRVVKQVDICGVDFRENTGG